MFITKSFTFDSAHNLTGHSGSCENLHGHTYRLEVTVTGPISEQGMVVDFKDLKAVVEKNIIQKLDHQYLNEVVPTRTTCENISLWIWKELEPYTELLNCKLQKITLYETPDSRIDIVLEK
ncbi:MAG: 6-carboxytetrahydropterin synthase QueD [Deltaproteobacteria bacterium]